MNTTHININSAQYRSTHKPVARTCEICHIAPAVKYATHRDERDGSFWSAWVCVECAGKVGR